MIPAACVKEEECHCGASKGEEVMNKKKLTDADRTNRAKLSYQQGFSKEGAALLARPWIKPEPPEQFTDYTLASFIKSSEGCDNG